MSENTIGPSLLDELCQLELDVKETRQGFRVVYRNPHSASTLVQQDIVYITPVYDSILEVDVIQWTQIEEKFRDALYLLNNSYAVPFIQNCDLEVLQPPRINTALEVTLEVIIENPMDEFQSGTPSSNSSSMEDSVEKLTESDIVGTTGISKVTKTMQSSDTLDDHEVSLESDQESEDFRILQCQNRRSGRGLALTKAENGNAESQTDIGMIYSVFLRNHLKILEWMLKAANQGFIRAQHCVGYVYAEGPEVTKDVTVSLEWYMKAAEQNDPIGQNGVGIFYEEGAGVAKDYSKAREWYMMSAVQGDRYAQNNLGKLYADGRSGILDYSEALKWYIKAAKQGNARAHDEIGDLYFYGHGLPRNLPKGLEWYLRSSRKGESSAQRSIGSMYFNGSYFPKDYPMAMKYYLKSANLGNKHAQTDVGNLYCSGLGVPENHTEALRWYLMAAKHGDARGQRSVGVMYYFGFGVKKDLTKAMECYEKAADMGDTIAKRNIGILYHSGLIGKKMDYPKALNWYGSAADEGDIESMLAIGRIYRNEYQNFTAALEWCLKAANSGSAHGQSAVGDIYYEGPAIIQDYSKALEWYLKSALQGNSESQCRAGKIYFRGTGVPLNYPKAQELLKMAANQGSADAQQLLITFYENCYGIPVDFAKVKEWMIRRKYRPSNAGAGKSSLLKLLGGTSFKSGTKFRGGFTKDIYEESVVINGEHVVLMDVPGLFEPNDGETIINAAKLTQALRRGYEYKLYFVLHAHCRGIPNEELLMMYKVNEVVRQAGSWATFRIIVNQIPDDDVYRLYRDAIAEDNCRGLFEELNIEGYSFNHIQIEEVMLVRFSSSDVINGRGTLSRALVENVQTHRAAPVTLSKPITTSNKELSFFASLLKSFLEIATVALYIIGIVAAI
ncbi:hypothetical protein BGZ76_005414 [Entomortierella beljakovae]|nr:hypothetical protein BGZ76_005414 [Entomortierella beljakovae]